MRLIDADVLKQHIDKLPALPDGNFAGNHSALKALINMQPTIESSTNCSEIQNSSDCISRQAAIDCLGFTWPEDAIRNLPSAQPKKGRWISADAIFGGVPFYCSECGENTRDTVMGKPRWKFCPMCGAKMEGADDE